MTKQEKQYLSELQAILWQNLEEERYNELIKNNDLKGAIGLNKELYLMNMPNILALTKEWARVWQICLDLNVPIIKTEKAKEISNKILVY